MNRRHFIGLAGGSVALAGTGAYLLSDRSSFSRADLRPTAAASGWAGLIKWQPDEQLILELAALAPSGHNTQPWAVRYVAPYRWVVCNDPTRWLPGVDPTQREKLLSIGAFLHNLEYAANSLGYRCQFTQLAQTNQDEAVVAVVCSKAAAVSAFDVQHIRDRRTVRSGLLTTALRQADQAALFPATAEGFHYIPNTAPEWHQLNEQTIEANRLQAARPVARQELADWIRFSNRDVAAHRDGLTTAGMEITGVSGWVVRNFYARARVLSAGFGQQTLDQVRAQVGQSAGWLLLTSRDTTVASLLDTGQRLQHLLLQIRRRGLAVHPMTQVLEEPATRRALRQTLGLPGEVQFLLRIGYLKAYPAPVSLRRPVAWFTHAA
ncbi:Acg family FMN-binding oxidoreductase [Hymenobacter canadensis]|uniref:Nitroreductase family protein n=1 Tax=Hymenobacter canadensis TaxID=2999067 RepID=A0ABY7LVF3_9BACT|nr:nitroreductase family protein [Hymenobacter canadensis]WBA43917.1 nitroreductase family protein [Hymenobacter canadensis]